MGHYGLLPAINALLACIAVRKKDDESIIALFNEIQPMIAAGNYSTIRPFFTLYQCSLDAALSLKNIDVAREVLFQLRSFPHVPRGFIQRGEASVLFFEGSLQKHSKSSP